MFQFKKDTVIKWYYYDGDEFSGRSIDREKWHTAFSWSEVNYDNQFRMTPERIVINNGIAHFTCDRDTGLYQVPDWHLDSAFLKKFRNDLVDGNKFKYYFTAGDVWSKGEYEKGYFEIRFKNTDAYGMWPGFWLYGKGDEIDFFELKGERNNQIHVDVHCPNHCDRRYLAGFIPGSFGGWIRTTTSLSENYNILAGEWQDGYVKWYLNGQGIAYYKGSFASDKMSLILGNGPAQDRNAFPPGVNAQTVFPNSVDVDYVRVWYKDLKQKAKITGTQQTQFDHFKTEYKPSRLKKKVRSMYNRKDFKKDLLTLSVFAKQNKTLLLTAVGRLINYSVSCYDMSGKELLSKTFNEQAVELPLAALTKADKIRIRVNVAGKIIEEIITLP